MSAQGTPPVPLIQCHHNGETTTARNLKLLKTTTTLFEKSPAKDIVTAWNEAMM